MDGSFNSTVLNTTSLLVFTLDRSKQVLYWIQGRHSCYLESSNTDGSNRSIVYNTTRNDGGCNGYYYMDSNYFQAMDFFGGAVYTFSPSYNRYIYKTATEGISNVNYMHYSCNSYTALGMKVISRQRQIQSK